MELIDTDPLTEAQRYTKLYHCATLVGGWGEERQQFTVGMGDQPVDPAAHFDERTTYKESYVFPTREQLATAKPSSCFTLEAPRELMFYHGDLLQPVKSQIPLSELSWSNRRTEPYTSPQTLEIMGVSRRQALTSAALKSKGMLNHCSPDSGTHPAVEKESAYLRSLQRVYLNTNDCMKMEMENGCLHQHEGCCCQPQKEDQHDTYVEDRDKALHSDGGASQSVTCYPVISQKGGDYIPPGLPPIGRVAERNRLLTTKQVTIDATGVYLRSHLHPYPATSSDCFGGFVKDCDNVMHRTKLRTEWETCE